MVRPNVYSINSQKGGVGKSMCSRHGSLLMNSAALIDLDPQSTTKRWVDKRREAGFQQPPLLLSTYKALPKALEACAEHDIQNVIIDTAPEHDDLRSIIASVEVADYVIIPTKASDDDLEVISQTAQHAINAGKPFCFVLNMVKPKTNMAAYAREYLAALAEKLGGQLCPYEICDRVAFLEANHFNKGVNEYEPKGRAHREVLSVWKWIVEQRKLHQLKNGGVNDA